uniref:Uncharacterized protein n=1 Tax=Hanusia phi TaxID=3032 RepID=A0A7S0H9W3_9CRYP
MLVFPCESKCLNWLCGRKYTSKDQWVPAFASHAALSLIAMSTSCFSSSSSGLNCMQRSSGGRKLVMDMAAGHNMAIVAACSSAFTACSTSSNQNSMLQSLSQ